VLGSVLPGGLNFDIAKTPFLTPIFPGERRVSSKISLCFCFAQFFFRRWRDFFIAGLPCFGVPAFARTLRFARYCLFAWGQFSGAVPAAIICKSKIDGRTRGRLLEGAEWKSLERLRLPKENWECCCPEWAR